MSQLTQPAGDLAYTLVSPWGEERTMEDNELRQVLVGSPWVCIPVFTGVPSELEVNFFDDGTGSVYYAMHIPKTPMPRTTNTDLGWTSNGEGTALQLNWPGQPLALASLSVTESSLVVFDGNGDEVLFTRKIVSSIHFFPLQADFPDGWPKEYFGYKSGGDA